MGTVYLKPNPSRRFHWVSALEPEAAPALEALQRQMNDFYSNAKAYYDDIEFTSTNWTSDLVYLWIAKAAQTASRILEIGCGRANILSYYPDLAPRYTGVDFSSELIEENRHRYPSAEFFELRDARRLNLSGTTFDLIISVFVLEHCVFPHTALNEWARLLVTGGRLIILAPDFLGHNRMTSQRIGFSVGSGREKLARRQFSDAIVTAFDTRVRLPVKATLCRIGASLKPQFYINLAPICFVDPFQPDVDAIYVTYKPEIERWLKGVLLFDSIDSDVAELVRQNRLILLDGRKIC
jgi:SAM-dependent methyltransferase